jgi:Predicted membrane protein (DUF2207)
MHRKSRSTLFASVFLAVFLCVLCFGASAQTPFRWNAINVDMDIQANGDMWVAEQQEYSFTEQYSTQRYRYIPLSKVDQIRDVTVQENGQPLPTQTGIENNQFWIRWDHALKAPEVHTFLIKYRVLGGYQISGQTTQIYWKAIFADRKAPVNTAKVQVQVPEQLAGKISSFKSFGALASNHQINPRTFKFLAYQPIAPQSELEVQLSFPSHTVNWPSPQWQTKQQSSTSDWGVGSFLIGLPLILFMLAIGSAINSSSGSYGGGG